MRVGETILKIVVTYASAVLTIALVLSVHMLIESGEWTVFGNSVLFIAQLAAIFALPVFLFVGLPYLALGYPSWGMEHVRTFIVTGAIMGGLGSLAFGMIIALPEAVPTFFPIVGVFAGAVSSVVWAQLSKRMTGIARG